MKKVITVVLAISLAMTVAGCDNSKAQQNLDKSAPSASKESPVEKPVVIRDQAQNAAPLGVEIGYANLKGVKEKLGSVATLKDQGVNEYSGGPMLVSDGAGLGVEGLSQLVLIFDKTNILTGVVMTLPKDPKNIFSQLSAKYKPVDNRIDNFMNYGSARLQKGDSLIEIDAPHLSFAMEVRYLTKQLMADYKTQSADQEARKKQDQANKL